MSQNPLKQYFRRPAIYFKLPSGGSYYTPDVVDIPENSELPVYPMTAIDEVTSRTPDALFNGQAVVDIIKSCIPAIKDPWRLNTIDLDAIYMAIRIASSGETMDFSCECPKCKAENKFGVDMVKLLNSRVNVDYNKSLKVRDLEIKFRPLTLAETNKSNIAQYEIQKILFELSNMEETEERAKQANLALQRLGELTADMLARTVEYIQTPETIVTETSYIHEFINNCDRATNKQIKDFSLGLREANELAPLNLKCIECQHEFSQPLILNISDFFA